MSALATAPRIRIVRDVLARGTRDRARYRVEAIAARIGSSPQKIYSWQSGEREPRVGEAIALARDLGVTVEQLWLPL